MMIDDQILFGMFQGFKKATPYGGTRKLRLTLPPECRELKDTITQLRQTFKQKCQRVGGQKSCQGSLWMIPKSILL